VVIKCLKCARGECKEYLESSKRYEFL